eukprot:g16587.t1
MGAQGPATTTAQSFDLLEEINLHACMRTGTGARVWRTRTHDEFLFTRVQDDDLPVAGVVGARLKTIGAEEADPAAEGVSEVVEDAVMINRLRTAASNTKGNFCASSR